MMTIEVLYSEIYIYGERFNVNYLKQCLPKAKFIYTNINDVPSFTKKKVDMVYMGSIPDIYQEMIINKLKPYKKKIKEMIDSNVVFLITGNALDLFGKQISEENKNIPGLDIFKFNVKRNYEKRHNSWFIGTFNGIKIIGNKSQFSFIYGNVKNYFIDIISGYGLNYEHKYEGIQYKNFYGTKLLGPFLILNPLFTEYLLKKLNIKNKVLYKDELLAAYNARVEQLSDPNFANFIETLVKRQEVK